MHQIIKVKVWNRLLNQFVPTGSAQFMATIIITSNGNIQMCSDDYVLVQYTGMKDYLGNEIYDGDVMLFTEGGEKWLCNVIWLDGAWYLLYHGNDESNSPVELMWPQIRSIENDEDIVEAGWWGAVVGNGFENPELSEGKASYEQFLQKLSAKKE